jgi:hypothetical protein
MDRLLLAMHLLHRRVGISGSPRAGEIECSGLMLEHTGLLNTA